MMQKFPGEQSTVREGGGGARNYPTLFIPLNGWTNI